MPDKYPGDPIGISESFSRGGTAPAFSFMQAASFMQRQRRGGKLLCKVSGSAEGAEALADVRLGSKAEVNRFHMKSGLPPVATAIADIGAMALRHSKQARPRLLIPIGPNVRAALAAPLTPHPWAGPGDSVLMEDVSGKGHRAHVKGAEECIAAVIPITNP